MNEHLKPILANILPSITEVEIPYWVYGGVAIAGIAGRFLRHNNDIDVFVLEEHYAAVLDVVDKPANSLGWQFRDTNFRDRPKREFFPPSGGKDVLSLMPIYRDGGIVRIVFQTSEREFPERILTQQIRTLGPHKFATPETAVIKELFITNLKYLVRSKKFERRPELREKYRRDAEVILDENERESFWGQYH